MKLYKLVIQETAWQQQEEELMAYVSPQRRAKVRGYRKVMDQKLSLYSALLVTAVSQKRFGFSQTSFDLLQMVRGKPFLANQPGFHFNVSHTEQVVICGFASQPIGVDVEKIGDYYPDIMPNFFHEEERLRFMKSPHKNQTFYEVWTRKEAYVKCEGSGISQNLTLINTYQAQTQRFFHSWQENGYQFGVYSETAAELTIIKIETEALYTYFTNDH